MNRWQWPPAGPIAAGNNRLGYAYDYHHVKTLNGQLLKAGIRLAGILNALYGA